MDSWLAASTVTLSAVLAFYMLELQPSNGITQVLFKPAEENGVYCDEFFFGTFFPIMKGNQSGLVRLCQTQLHSAFGGPAVYATLYSTADRIPVYSAAAIQLFPNCPGYTRPDEKYWNRVSLTLCDSPVGPVDMPFPSRIGHGGQNMDQCGKHQALNSDYTGNHEAIGIDRGHLNPNAINCQDEEKQLGTFTLTNAAPQFSKFNEIAWRQYECITEDVLAKYVPTERVYIITGTYGIANDSKGNPLWMNGNDPNRNSVKIPGYYWKAVCYPGNEWQGKEPWGFAVLHINSNSDSPSSPNNFMKLSEFSSIYFDDDLFGEVCLNAGLGPVQEYFDTWENVLDVTCGSKPVLECNQ